MKKRVSKKVVSGVTTDQFNEAMAIYASANAKEAALNAKADEQITKIREKYAEDVTAAKTEQERALDTMQVYCTENQDTLFAKKKSYDTIHGTVGFRKGTPKLKTRRGFTWASVLELLKVKMPDYVRKTEEINKELLLADRESDKVKANLYGVGIQVAQDESFFVDLKKEET